MTTSRQSEGQGKVTAAPVIDCHAHVYVRGLPLAPNATHDPTEDHVPQEYLSVLDRAGVTYGVLTAPSFLGTDNSYLLAALRAHPRLRGTAIVAPECEDATLQAMAREGVSGIRFSLNRYPDLPDLSSLSYRRLLDRIGALGLYVHLFVESSRIERLLPALLASGVRLVLDHFGTTAGSGEGNSGLRAAWKAIEGGNTWIKLSAPNRTGGADVRRLAREYLAAAGTERMLWGSDWPWVGYQGITYGETIAWFEDWIPDPEMRAAIGRTGLKLHGLADG